MNGEECPVSGLSRADIIAVVAYYLRCFCRSLDDCLDEYYQERKRAVDVILEVTKNVQSYESTTRPVPVS